MGIQSWKDGLKTNLDQKSAALRARETELLIAFFVGGIIFDWLMLSEPNDPFSIAQQIVYLIIIGWSLFGEDQESQSSDVPKGKWQLFYQRIRLPLVHFILGSLLSLYSIFYLMSSSFMSSAIFLFILGALLVLNEMEFVQNSKIPVRLALFTFCLFSFFSVVLPIVTGSIGVLTFILSLFFTGLLVIFLLQKKEGHPVPATWHSINSFRMAGGVLAALLGLYVLGWIPPVPLAIKGMGIYHDVKKENGSYLLSHENPIWKFWSAGDQDFVAQPGDKIYFFTEIYSPQSFSDSVVVRWSFKDPRLGWQKSDDIPMKISGGRSEGFRGFQFKSNFTEGEWCIQVLTTDGREIGRIYFDVTKVESSSERQFVVERR